MRSKKQFLIVDKHTHTITKFQNKYRIESARLRGYDYGSHGYYFVTICAKNRINYFGEISVYTEICNIANNFWKEIPTHYPLVEIDHFIVMPNHIHGVLFFNRPDKKDWNTNKFGVQSQNLGAVIRAFKSSVKRYANQNKIDFE